MKTLSLFSIFLFSILSNYTLAMDNEFEACREIDSTVITVLYGMDIERRGLSFVIGASFGLIVMSEYLYRISRGEKKAFTLSRDGKKVLVINYPKQAAFFRRFALLSRLQEWCIGKNWNFL